MFKLPPRPDSKNNKDENEGEKKMKPNVVFFLCRFAGAESKKKNNEEIFHLAQLPMPETQATRFKLRRNTDEETSSKSKDKPAGNICESENQTEMR